MPRSTCAKLFTLLYWSYVTLKSAVSWSSLFWLCDLIGGPYFFDQWNHKQCWESLQTRPGNLAIGGNEPVHHARSGFLKNVRGLKRAGYRIVWLKHFGLRNPTKKFGDENVWGLECFKRPPNVLGKGNTFLRHFQRKALKFRLIFLEFKSSITHPISQFLGNKFIKYLYSFWNRAKINSKPNF